MEVVAHTAIPMELLSDQGSVFIGKVNSELCRLLNIVRLKTTAYHPPKNGVLKSCHSCLKEMLRKVEGGKEGWDRLLKNCLLAYRATPHASTGFSPYKLDHERNLRGPLEPMKTEWVKGDLSSISTVEWVNKIRKTLTTLHQAVYENEEAHNEKSTAAYDLCAKPRSFEPGDMVIFHIPGLTWKLDSIWEGPKF